MRRRLPPLLFASLLAAPASAHLPDGYVDEPFLDGLEGAVGVVFDADGRAYAWETAGRVYVVEDGALVRPPLLDISDEVGRWRDFGMLGFALDPNFLVNGRFYTYYVVDRHHLLFHGTPDYNPNHNDYFAATIGRVTRYTADATTGFTTLVPGSRHVLLGDTIDSGVPILHQSHGTGALAFGADGTLLLSSGDGANYNGVDAGSSPGTYWSVALQDGIIRPEENVGAFRSQMIGSLNGKILRIDPETGDGIPSSPFYDPAAPRAARSRVWALGFRNPYRFSVRPGTGDPDPTAGNPGVLYIGDVGWESWECLHVVREGGVNRGWPLFEGLKRNQEYRITLTENLDAPNPLYGVNGCANEYFTFLELLAEEREDHSPSFPNPCDPAIAIAPSTPTFMHHRPALDWRHGPQIARVPIFVDGLPRRSSLGDEDCPVEGESFQGSCAVGGRWLTQTGFGKFSGMYLLLDFSAGWMRALRFDADDHLEEVVELGDDLGFPLFAVQDPGDHSVLYGSGDRVRRIRYIGAGNVDPRPHLSASTDRGTSPLTVRFDASTSDDPENELLAFHWDFGDGATATEPSPQHVFVNAEGPPLRTIVTLEVTDSQGAIAAEELAVYLDNTPPAVAITSIPDGARYSTSEPTELVLEALVSDLDSPPEQLSYAWQVFLHHDGHEHPEPVDTNEATTALLTPTPCTGSFYAYRVELTVADGQGLASKVSRWILPDCALATTVEVAPAGDGELLPGRESTLVAQVQGIAERVDVQVDGERVGTSFQPPHEVTWKPERPGPFMLSAVARLRDGTSASSPGRTVEVLAPTRREVAVSSAREEVIETAIGRVLPGGAIVRLGGAHTTGLRLPLDVPHGATIVHAHLEWTAGQPGDALTRLAIWAEASDDAAPLRLVHQNLSTRPTTVAEVSWDVAPWRYALASGPRQTSPELGALLQEVVDRDGFEAGNALVLLITGEGDRRAVGVKPGSGRGARLVVDYHEPAR